LRIALGSDHAGYSLKEQIKEYLQAGGIAYTDFGTFCENSVDYPDISLPVIRGIRDGEFQYGILICGTGVGMAIAACKYVGIRAALCSEPFTARCAREHNDANILTLGARVTGPGLAQEIVETFLKTPFAGGRHQKRLDKIILIEKMERSAL
jgi:ribose 5-phosphate isomerase B